MGTCFSRNEDPANTNNNSATSNNGEISAPSTSQGAPPGYSEQPGPPPPTYSEAVVAEPQGNTVRVAQTARRSDVAAGSPQQINPVPPTNEIARPITPAPSANPIRQANLDRAERWRVNEARDDYRSTPPNVPYRARTRVNRSRRTYQGQGRQVSNVVPPQIQNRTIRVGPPGRRGALGRNEMRRGRQSLIRRDQPTNVE